MAVKKNGSKKHMPCGCSDCRKDRREWKKLGRQVLKDEKAQKTREAQWKAEELARPPNLVSYTEAAEAINKLRLYHHQVVEEVAVSLRPRFEAGELYGCFDTPGGSKDDAKGVKALLDEIRERTGGREDACLTLAFSPSTEAVSEYAEGDSLVEQAVQTLASDVLRVARLRKFYEMKPGESIDLWA